jgi:hypothetical protein
MNKYTYLPAINLYICYSDKDEITHDNMVGWVWKRVHYIRLDEVGEEQYGVYKRTNYTDTINHYVLEWIEPERIEKLDDENPYDDIE